MNHGPWDFYVLTSKEGTEEGLPWSEKLIWKMKIFPGQGKVREFWFESGKLGKTDKSQGKVREF